MRRFAQVSAVVAVLGTALLAPAAGTAAAGLPQGGLAPVPHTTRGTVYWAPVGVETSYRLAISTAPRGVAGRRTTYLTLARAPGELQTYRPTVTKGHWLWVEVSADGGRVWSTHEARVIYTRHANASGAGGGGSGSGSGEEEASSEEGAGEQPTEGEKGEPEREPILPARTIIGTDDGSGWGAEAARTILAGHVTWDRVEVGSWPHVVQTSLEDGFKVLAIVGNVDDGTPLSHVEASAWAAQLVSQLQANPGISLAEVGNEMYLKGGVANPAQYGRMYLAAVRAARAAGIETPLLFNMTGGYPHGSWSAPQGWSLDGAEGGWLREAVRANPGLGEAILENGVSIHPYGALGENNADDYGVNAVPADEAVARAVLGAVPPTYITEFGYTLAACGRDLGACSHAEQATKMAAAYAAFLEDPNVRGIWWYQSHDDGTGMFGFMERDGATRPSFSVLSAIAQGQGQ